MYVTSSIYDTFARYVDLDDRSFFLQALKIAKDNYLKLLEEDRSKIKQHTPVCFVSTLSGKKDSENFASRKLLNTDRARRKFLMIDADFSEGEEERSERLQEKLKDLANQYQTPLMIYPTVSYPEKPRFRAVLLVKRGLTPQKYWSAMTWLYRELETSVLDKSDLRISANRNLPVFCNDEQIEKIYSTFEDLNLKELDNSLWKDIEAPKKTQLTKEQLEDLSSVKYDEDKLIDGVKTISTKDIVKSYETFWQIAASLAAGVVLEQLDEELVFEMLDMLAEVGENSSQIAKWQAGNRELYQQFKSQYTEIPENIAKARPLHTYTEFSSAATIMKGDNT